MLGCCGHMPPLPRPPPCCRYEDCPVFDGLYQYCQVRDGRPGFRGITALLSQPATALLGE